MDVKDKYCYISTDIGMVERPLSGYLELLREAGQRAGDIFLNPKNFWEAKQWLSAQSACFVDPNVEWLTIYGFRIFSHNKVGLGEIATERPE